MYLLVVYGVRPRTNKLVREVIARRSKMRMNPLRNKVVLVVGFSIVILFGVTAYASIVNILAVGTIPNSEVLGGPATVTFRTIALAPGEVSGWHYHPGPVVNVVTRGTVTVEDGCGGEESFIPGQAFETMGGRIHRAKNLGTEETFEYNTFIIPPGNPLTVNIPNNQRLCGPVRTVNECKENGWMNFTYPHAFNNQGECVSFVQAHNQDLE
jgi:quercetin dioxygenase-like cupin family protein